MIHIKIQCQAFLNTHHMPAPTYQNTTFGLAKIKVNVLMSLITMSNIIFAEISYGSKLLATFFQLKGFTGRFIRFQLYVVHSNQCLIKFYFSKVKTFDFKKFSYNISNLQLSTSTFHLYICIYIFLPKAKSVIIK